MRIVKSRIRRCGQVERDGEVEGSLYKPASLRKKRSIIVPRQIDNVDGSSSLLALSAPSPCY